MKTGLGGNRVLICGYPQSFRKKLVISVCGRSKFKFVQKCFRMTNNIPITILVPNMKNYDAYKAVIWTTERRYLKSLVRAS